MANVYEYVIQKQASNQITSKWNNFLAMERKGRDLFKSLLEDGNITKYKESTGQI